MKPKGRAEDLVGQSQEAAVDQDDHHADAERLADHPAICFGHLVEQSVEAPEQPAEDGVYRADDEPTDREAGRQAGAK